MGACRSRRGSLTHREWHEIAAPEDPSLTYSKEVAAPIRTSTFSRRAKRLLPEVEIARLEQCIAERPDAHPVIAGNGWGSKGAMGSPRSGKTRRRASSVLFPDTRSNRVYARHLRQE